MGKKVHRCKPAGPENESMSDLFTAGDVIYVRPRANNGEATDGVTSYLLAQAPEVQGSLISLNPRNGSDCSNRRAQFYQSKYNRAIQANGNPAPTLNLSYTWQPWKMGKLQR